MSATLPSRATVARHTALLTGATGALGSAIAHQLAAQGVEVVLVARDATRGEALRASVIAATGNERVHLETADLAVRDEVKALVQRFMDNHSRIGSLVHAAGTLESERVTTDAGVERTWATNVLGFYQVASRLTEMLRYCRPSRIVAVTSSHAGGLVVSDPQYRQRAYRPWQAYTASQQAVRMLVRLFAQQLDPDVVTVNAVDPGPVTGGLIDRAVGITSLPARALRKLAGVAPDQVAQHVVHAALAPELAEVSGRLLHRGQDVGPAWADASDQQALLALCSATTRVHPEWDSNIWREEDSAILDVRGGA